MDPSRRARRRATSRRVRAPLSAKAYKNIILVLTAALGFALGFSGGGIVFAVRSANNVKMAHTIVVDSATGRLFAPEPLHDVPDVGVPTEINSLNDGTCLYGRLDPYDGSSALNAVSCEGPYLYQVISAALFGNGPFPGQYTLDSTAEDACRASVSYLPEQQLRPSEVSVFAWVPTEASWEKGRRRALCLASLDSGDTLMGSFLDGTAQAF